jgi:hypothetical protein
VEAEPLHQRDLTPEEQANEERRRRLLAHAQDLDTIFSSAAGERVLDEWNKTALRQSHVYGDPYATAFRDGERTHIIKVMHLIRLYRTQPATIGRITTEEEPS